MNCRIQLLLYSWSGENIVLSKCNILQCQMLWVPAQLLKIVKLMLHILWKKKVTISCKPQLVLSLAGKKMPVFLIDVVTGCPIACLDPILFVDKWVKISSF